MNVKKKKLKRSTIIGVFFSGHALDGRRIFLGHSRLFFFQQMIKILVLSDEYIPFLPFSRADALLDWYCDAFFLFTEIIHPLNPELFKSLKQK
jgi:hypothetical protein